MRKKKKSKLIKCENNKYIYVYNDWETLGSVKRILSSSEKEANDKKEADDIKKYEYLEKLRKEGTLTSAVKYYILAYVIETYTLSEIIPYRNRCEKRICDNIGYLKADLITSAQVNDYLSGITHLYNDSGLKSIAACIKESVRCMTDRELDITVPKSRLNNRYILSNEEKKDFEKYCISINNDECIIYDERQCDIKFLLEVDREREKYLTPEFIKAARNIKLNQLKADKNGLRAYMSLRTPDSTFNRLNMDKNNKVEFIYTYDNTLTIKAYDKELKSSEKELKFNSYQTDYLKMMFKENFTSNDREFDMLLEEKQKEVQKPKTKVKKKEIEMSLLA